MTSEERESLIAQLCEGRFDLQEQLNVVALLPEEKLKVFDERLRVLAAYEVDKPYSVQKAAAAAAELSMTPRNMNYLLKKMRTMGAGRGLAPSFRNKQRPSARQGLDPDLDKALIDFLKAEPEAKLAAIYARLQRDFGEGAVPSRPTVRSRVSELRSSPLLEFAANRIAIGQDLVCDQCGLDLAAGGLYAIATFVIDKQSRLILGWAVTGDDGEGLGLAEAVRGALLYLIGSVPRNLRVATSIRSIEWVVAPGLEAAGEKFAEITASRSIEGRLVLGDRRHGSRLRRLIGNRLGPFNYRSSTGTAAEKVEGESVPQITYLDILQNVDAEVLRHNTKIIDAFSTAAAPSSSGERDAHVRTIGMALGEVFLSVLPQKLSVEIEQAIDLLAGQNYENSDR